MTVAVEFLFEGVVHALRSARLCLVDAIFLYRNDKSSSAYILGVIAAEHLGRANWITGQWQQMKNNSLTSLDCGKFKDDLRKRDHQTTLGDGLRSLQFLPTPEENRISESLYSLDPKDPQYAEASKQFRGSLKTRIKRAPVKYYETRVQAQYVSPSDACVSWSSPQQVTSEQCHDLLLNVGNNYRLLSCAVREHEPTMQIIQQMGIQAELEDFKGTWPPPEADAVFKAEERQAAAVQKKT